MKIQNNVNVYRKKDALCACNKHFDQKMKRAINKESIAPKKSRHRGKKKEWEQLGLAEYFSLKLVLTVLGLLVRLRHGLQ